MRNPYEVPFFASAMAVSTLGFLGLIYVTSIPREKMQIAPMPIARPVKPDNKCYQKIPASIMAGTFRVRCKTKVFEGVIERTKESYGSAFGIDVKEFGSDSKRYLVTAAHVVLEGPMDDRISDLVEIQIRTASVKKWISCRVLVASKDKDLAVLEASEDLPMVFGIAKDAEVGSSIIICGCPGGTTPGAAMGWLASKDPEIPTHVKCGTWQAAVPFFFGNSGGPIFDAETEKVIAVLVGGLGDSMRGMIPHLAICIPCTEVRNVLTDLFSRTKIEPAPLPK